MVQERHQGITTTAKLIVVSQASLRYKLQKLPFEDRNEIKKGYNWVATSEWSEQTQLSNL